MCNPACLSFVERVLTDDDVRERAILEVGSKDVNGSPRDFIERMAPSRYLGVDLVNGAGVDEVLDASALVERFGPESFDVVISTEMVEHVLDWRRALTNLKHVVGRGGTLLITTRSRGARYHGFPYDFWRYELSDMADILRDFKIEALESDPSGYGVFVKATKPQDYIEADLSDVRLYSMLAHRRMRSFSPSSARLIERLARNANQVPGLRSVKNWRRRRYGFTDDEIRALEEADRGPATLPSPNGATEAANTA